jgi:hypothetical protein
MHSNIDRLWAMWQRQPVDPERLNPATAYGSESNSTGSGDVEFGDPSCSGHGARRRDPDITMSLDRLDSAG